MPSNSQRQQLRQHIGAARRRDPAADVTALQVQLREAKAEKTSRTCVSPNPTIER